MKIDASTTRQELAAIVVDKLRQHEISAVLVGGSVVSIYTNNKYESNDLDFVAPAADERIEKAMKELGFTRKGKDFKHNETELTVEFPGRTVAIGDMEPVKPEGKMTVEGIDVVMLSPTQSVMDRLAWFFFNNDRQCLDQAVWIAQSQPIDTEKLRSWAKRERQEEKLEVFLKRIS